MPVSDQAPSNKHTCAGCGYSLDGLDPGKRCPECARRPLPDRPLVDPDARAIDIDIACVSCGYNLRGLDPNGRCPECSRPISKSLSRGKGFTPAECRLVARKLAWALLTELAEIAGVVLAFVIPLGGTLIDKTAEAIGVVVFATAAAVRAKLTLDLTRMVAAERVTDPYSARAALRQPVAAARWLVPLPAMIHAASVIVACVLFPAVRWLNAGDGAESLFGLAAVIAFFSAAVCGLVLLSVAEQIAFRTGWPRYVRTLENTTIATLFVSILGFPLFGLGPLVAYIVYQVVLWGLVQRVRSRDVWD